MSDKRNVLITGAGQGIGRQFALGLAERGYRVVAADIDESRVHMVVADIASAGGSALELRVDVSDPVSCAAAAQQVEDSCGHLDGLVNNAALFASLAMRPFWEIPVEEWRQVLDVNLIGAWLVTTSMLELLRKAEAASIVNIAASAVWIGRPNYAHYVSSKAGLIGLTWVMARELAGDGIRVNVVTPGSIQTEVPRKTVTPDQLQAMIEAQCVRRPGRPGDLVGTVAFLLGPDSAFLSGQAINVDGGLTVR